MPITPDTKDWTWVLTRSCSDCGFDATSMDRAQLTALLHGNAMSWAAALETNPDVRPSDDVWSPLEYACHVRDVHRIFDLRVAEMLESDVPTFANWDQDAAAITDDYDSQDPVEVELELIEAAAAVAGRYAEVADDQWERRGIRSNGDEFTIDSIARYHLHDVVHHVWDVTPRR